jgi:hypothetical protein
MNRRDRVKYYRTLKKRADMLNASLPGQNKSVTSVVPDGTPKAVLNFGGPQHEYSVATGPDNYKEYIKQGEFYVIDLVELKDKPDGSKAKNIYRHYFNPSNPKGSKLELLYAEDSRKQVGYSFGYYTIEYENAFTKNRQKWHDGPYKELMDKIKAEEARAAKEKEEKEKKDKPKTKDPMYGVQVGSQGGFREGYKEELAEKAKYGEIFGEEENIKDYISTADEEELAKLEEAIRSGNGVSYGIPNDREKQELALKEIEDRKTETTSITEDKSGLGELPKKGEAVDSKVVAKLHPNFDLIPDGMRTNYRGGALYTNPKEQFELLRDKYGIKRVVKLNGNEYLSAAEEKEIVEDLGMEFYKINAESPSNNTTGTGFVNSVRDTSNVLRKGNTYVHCSGGMDRTGFTVAAWLKEKRGIGDDNVNALEELYTYTTQYNSWDKYICNVGFSSTDKKTKEKKWTVNNKYGMYLDSFYPIRAWCKAKPSRANCKVCKDIDYWYPENGKPKKK